MMEVVKIKGEDHYQCRAVKTERDILKARVRVLEDRLFALGEMENSPCFCCGYNGAGYFNPEQHPCAKRYHKLREEL